MDNLVHTCINMIVVSGTLVMVAGCIGTVIYIIKGIFK